MDHQLPSQQEAAHDNIAIPLSSSTYGGHHHMMHHHHHHHDSPPPLPHHHHHHHPHSIIPQIPPNTNGSSMENDHHHQQGGFSSKKPSAVVGPSVKYRECLKNHAAGMGGNATDGCGEFMPSGEEGTIEALTCSACSCHRNFHRKETEGDHLLFPYDHSSLNNPHLRVAAGRKLFLGYPTAATGTLIHSSRPSSAVPQQMIMSYNMGPAAAAAGSHSLPSDQSDHDQEEMGGVVARAPHHHHHHQMGSKKRFRTKFTAEQKEKMLGFAEKVGWKIQKQEESVVQQFCQEIGVKRRVLKVWMHNNKHNLAKKNNNNLINNNNNSNNPSHHHDQLLVISAAPNINSSTTS